MEKILVFMIGVVTVVLADFACICNYNVEQGVLDSTSDSAHTLGYMYEFDCKEQVPMSPASDTWYAIAIEHQTGYVKKGSGLQLSLCAGSPPEEDKITTSATTPQKTQILSTTSQYSSTARHSSSTTATTRASTTSTKTTTKPVTTPKPTTTTITTTTTSPITATLYSSTTKSVMTTTRVSTATSSTTAAPSATQSVTSSTSPVTSTTRSTTSSTTSTPSISQPTTQNTTAAKLTTRSTTSSTTTAPSTTRSTTSSTASAPSTSRSSTSSTTSAPSTSQSITPSTTAAPSTTRSKTSSSTTTPLTTQYITSSTTSAQSTSQLSTSSTTSALSASQNTTSSTAAAQSTSRSSISSTTPATTLTTIVTSTTPSTMSSTTPATSTPLSTILFTTTATSTAPITNSSATESTTPSSTTLSTTSSINSTTRTSPTDMTTNTTTGTSTLKIIPSSPASPSSISVSTTRLPLTSISGATSLCQAVHIQHASLYSNNLARYGDYCYELMPYQKVTWQHGEALCQSGGGHLVDIRNSGEQAFIQKFVQRHIPNHVVWIGLHDRKTENHFQWTSGFPVFYTHWLSGHMDNVMNHTTEDCVVLVPYKNGAWDDIPCGVTGILGSDIGETHPIVCKFDAHAKYQITTLPSVTRPDGSPLLGNANLCPRQLQQHAVAYGNTLAQYGSYCYELMPHIKVSWIHGENICRSSGGNLVHIGSEETQHFVESFLKRYMPTHATWIGLHDLNTESQFEWTTGNKVSYTNWLPSHTDNFTSHISEDCVVLIPYKGGHWDDIPCGDTGTFIGGDIGGTHPIICQYDITTGPPMVG